MPCDASLDLNERENALIPVSLHEGENCLDPCLAQRRVATAWERKHTQTPRAQPTHRLPSAHAQRRMCCAYNAALMMCPGTPRGLAKCLVVAFRAKMLLHGFVE